jgi:L-malate glycosyltransferase
MNPEQTRVAILGGISSEYLKPYIKEYADDASAPVTFGGTNISNLVVERLKRGWPTDVITFSPELGKSERIQRWGSGAGRLWILQSRDIPFRATRSYPSESAVLHRAFREANPDLIHANWAYEYGWGALTQAEIPVVLTPHDYADRILKLHGWRYFARWVMTQRCYRKAAFLTAPSPAVAEFAARRSGHPVTVIPNLMTDEFWEQTSLLCQREGSALRVVSALDWSSLKNTKNALRAFQILKRSKPDAEYLLAGGGGLEPGGRAEQWAVAHGCAEGVRFLGRIPYSEMLAHIAGANILFHSSLEECMPGPVIEAMALMIPVVAAREASGSLWLLDGGICGRLSSGLDVEAMGRNLLAAVDQQDATAAMVEQAYFRARCLSRAQTVLDAYNRVYEEAICSFGD